MRIIFGWLTKDLSLGYSLLDSSGDSSEEIWEGPGYIEALPKKAHGTTLVVQWLRPCASNTGDASLIPCWWTKIPHATWHNKKINKIKSNYLFFKSPPKPNEQKRPGSKRTSKDYC